MNGAEVAATYFHASIVDVVVDRAYSSTDIILESYARGDDLVVYRDLLVRSAVRSQQTNRFSNFLGVQRAGEVLA